MYVTTAPPTLPRLFTELLPEEIDARITIPATNRITSVTRAEGSYLHAFLRDHGLKRTLEVGFAYGYSTACIMSATRATHVVIDPFQESYANLGLRNIDALGLSGHLVHLSEFSHAALPKLLAQGRTFQWIFVDGGHKFDDIFIDWYYADLLLEPGGYVLFHDAWMPSTRTVAGFVRNNRQDYQERETPIENLLLFQKKGVDSRSWHHFNAFAGHP
ncbi:MAG: class I SAM-dependent methyltransferase [Cytophagales bacterium]|nr:class I SAM-dependent methyltransferase [Cytophagales bacterium]